MRPGGFFGVRDDASLPATPNADRGNYIKESLEEGAGYEPNALVRSYSVSETAYEDAHDESGYGGDRLLFGKFENEVSGSQESRRRKTELKAGHFCPLVCELGGGRLACTKLPVWKPHQTKTAV
jgi:hypothetical protein